MIKIITANTLIEGMCVWLERTGNWSTFFPEGALLSSEEEVDRFTEIAKKSILNNDVVDVNLVDVKEVDGRYVPVRLRERIRAFGPTVKTSFGGVS